MQTINAWDLALYRYINLQLTSTSLDPVMVFLSSPVTWTAAFVFGILGFALLRYWRAVRILLLVLLGFGICDVVCSHVLKPGLGRVRPCHWNFDARRVRNYCGSEFGMPSNHASNGAAAVTIITFFGGPLLGAGAAVLAVAVGYSRVYLSVHFPGDVLAGFLFGSLVGLILALALRRWVNEGKFEWTSKSRQKT